MTDPSATPSPRSVREAVESARSAGRAAFVPYWTLGYPNEETSLAIVRRLDELGADVIELGVPFSDPVADGPTIQRSTERALANGMRLRRIFELFRDEAPKGAARLLFSYLNPLLAFGVDSLGIALAQAGIGGLLVTDLIPEESAILGPLEGVEFCYLVASTSSDQRMAAAFAASGGFVYCISTLGVTGARDAVDRSAEETVRRMRQHGEAPIAVGFGIRSAEDVREVAAYADAVIVGSALIDAVGDAEDPELACKRAEAFVAPLLRACKRV